MRQTIDSFMRQTVDTFMRPKFLLILFMVWAGQGLSGQQREAAFELNTRLGRGINMGNAFEAPTETEWGNPWKP